MVVVTATAAVVKIVVVVAATAATVVKVVVTASLNKIHHRKLTLERKILLPLLPEFELAIFRSRVRCSTNKLSRPLNVTAGLPHTSDNFIVFLGTVCEGTKSVG